MKRLLAVAAVAITQGLHAPSIVDYYKHLHTRCLAQSPGYEQHEFFAKPKAIRKYVEGCIRSDSIDSKMFGKLATELNESENPLTGYFLGVLLDQVPESQFVSIPENNIPFFGAYSSRGNLFIGNNHGDMVLYQAQAPDVVIYSNFGDCALWPRNGQHAPNRMIHHQITGAYHNEQDVRTTGNAEDICLNCNSR